jgi:hypothetical protein
METISRADPRLTICSNFVCGCNRCWGLDEERITKAPVELATLRWLGLGLGADENASSRDPRRPVSGRAPGVVSPEREKPEPRVWKPGFGTDSSWIWSNPVTISKVYPRHALLLSSTKSIVKLLFFFIYFEEARKKVKYLVM